MGRKRVRASQDLVYRVRLDDKDVCYILVALKHYLKCEYAYKDPEIAERIEFLVRKFGQISKWSKLHSARHSEKIVERTREEARRPAK